MVAKGTPEYVFRAHRYRAKYTDIPFLFTFEEWIKIWMDSGHWHERGKGKEKYCMARFGDKGPYAVGNVRIITNSENSKERNTHYSHSKETKAKFAAAIERRRKEGRFNKKGFFKHTPEVVAKMFGNKYGKANKGKKFTDAHKLKLSIRRKEYWDRKKLSGG